MAIMKVVKLLSDESEMVIGYVCQYPSGEYWFNPKLPHRRSSRVVRDTPEATIPRWARQMADRIEYIQGAG